MDAPAYILMFADLIILLHLAVHSAMKFRNSAGEVTNGTRPRSAILSSFMAKGIPEAEIRIEQDLDDADIDVLLQQVGGRPAQSTRHARNRKSMPLHRWCRSQSKEQF